MNLRICSFLLLLSVLKINAEDTISKIDIYTPKIIKMSNLMLNIDNPAKLYFNKRSSGLIENRYQEIDGEMHLFLETPKVIENSLHSEGYISKGKTNYYGKFEYSDRVEKHSNWTNNMYPYSIAPLFIGDSIENDYLKEYYLLEGAFATELNRRLIIGSHLSYKVASGITQKDPRVKNNYMNLMFTSGIIFKTEEYNIGFDIGYGKMKENLDFAKLQTKEVYWSFVSKGLGYFENIDDLGEADKHYISERWKSSAFVKFGVLNSENIIELKYETKKTELCFNDKNGIKLGDLNVTDFTLAYKLEFEKKLINRLSLTANYITQNGNNAEGIHLVKKDDTHIPQVTVYQPRNKNSKMDIDLVWLMLDTKNANNNYTIGTSFVSDATKYTTFRNSSKISFSNLKLYAGANRNFRIKKGVVGAKFKVSYTQNISSSIESGDYSKVIFNKMNGQNRPQLYHDYTYNSSNYLQSEIGINYKFRYKTYWPYLGFNYISTKVIKNSLNLKNRNFLTLSVGINL